MYINKIDPILEERFNFLLKFRNFHFLFYKVNIFMENYCKIPIVDCQWNKSLYVSKYIYTQFVLGVQIRNKNTMKHKIK